MLVRPAAVLPFLALLCAPAARAQAPACLERTIPVGVVNHANLPAPILGADNLRASYRGKAVTIRGVQEDREPRRIVVVLAAGERDAQMGLDLAADLATGALDSAQLGLAVVSREGKQLLEPAAGRARLTNAIAAWRLAGGPGQAALWDSVAAAADLLGDPEFGDVIYVISDGRSGRNSARPGAVADRLVASGARLFFVAITPAAGPAAVSPAPPGELARVARLTGGVFLLIPRSMAASLPGITLRTLYDRMVYPHRVEITLPEEVDRARDWRLELTGLLPQEMQNLELVYPQRLFPCR